MVHSPNDDTNFFDIVARVLQDILEPNMFINCLDYRLRTSLDQVKENGFTLKKKQTNRQYPTETMTDADDLVLLTNTPAQAKSQQHSLEQAARCIGIYMSANKRMLCAVLNKSWKRNPTEQQLYGHIPPI